jgi:hypothetical protein
MAVMKSGRLFRDFARAVLLFLAVLQAAVLAQEVPVLDAEISATLESMAAIRRDFYLDSQLNKMLQGRGLVESVEESGRYRRKFRIKLSSVEKRSVALVYYIYTSNPEYQSMLSKGDIFEFRGQLVVYTPLNSRRDSYIFDVVMEEGALKVE